MPDIEDLPKINRPTTGTRTERLKIKQKIRHELGTSRDGAPHVRRVFRAARMLHDLMQRTSGGVYGIAIVRNGSFPGPAELQEFADGWRE
ncbi:MAG TPA: hypothetical protein VFL77_05390 [Solirubrobacterales bacterium]|nr:hypothetical protein [Solirubrobacterales bacterium]